MRQIIIGNAVSDESKGLGVTIKKKSGVASLKHDRQTLEEMFDF